jgi:acyl dehydratase
VLAHQAFELAFSKIGAAREDGSEPSRVHLSQEIRADRLLLPDERITVEVDLLGARREAGGVRVAMRAVLVGADGVTFAELVTGALLGGAVTPEPFGELPPFPPHRAKSTATVLTRQLTVDSVRRYAEASGDENPIHLDDSVARAAGFDGVIAHGMRTSVFGSRRPCGRTSPSTSRSRRTATPSASTAGPRRDWR